VTFEAWPVAAWANDFTATDVRLQGGIVLLVLNRPDAANARNQQMRTELKATYEAVAASDDVLALIMRGAGEKFFCAGMDLKEASASTETIDEKRARLKAARDIEMLANLPQPTIAAINGYAMGGGLECALACDLRIAEEHAQLALPEATVGLLPCAGGTQNLPWLVGEGWAKRLILIGERIDAATALRIGLVEEVVPRGAALETALGWAQRTEGQSPTSVAACKQLIQGARSNPLKQLLPQEREAFVNLFDTLDQKEGVTAFLEKRKPEWRNG